jgi:hypothetical protein
LLFLLVIPKGDLLLLLPFPDLGPDEKIVEEGGMFFVAQKRGASSPRNSPQLHHQNTTTNTLFFQKPPVKTHLHQRQKNLLPAARFCDLPGDIHPSFDPLRIIDLLHHEVGHVCARDAAAVVWKSIAVDAIDTTSGSVCELHGHHHRPVKVAVGQIIPL